MKRFGFVQRVVVLGATLGAAPALAGPCSLIRDPGNPAPQVEIGKRTEVVESAKHIPDCSRIVVKSGSVLVLYQVNGEHQVKACEVGQACDVDPRSTSSFLARQSTEPTRVGQGLDTDYARLSGLPYGAILQPDSVATLTFARVQETVVRFTLFDQAMQPLLDAPRSGPSVSLPVGVLKPGARFRWRLETNRAKHEGSFRMVEEKTRFNVANALSAASKNSPNATVFERKLQQLAVYRDYDLGYEAEHLRQEMKL
jgi:hypothetical protein